MSTNKAPIIGTGGGAALGFMVGGPLGALIGGGLGFLGGKRYSVTHGMTPERKAIYEAALKSLKDPVQLRKLADEFEGQGLTEEAELLRKRAALRELSPDQKAARKNAFRKAISIGKGGTPVTPEQIATVEKMAAAFHKQGATGNAAALRQHAEGLKNVLKAIK